MNSYKDKKIVRPIVIQIERLEDIQIDSYKDRKIGRKINYD